MTCSGFLYTFPWNGTPGHLVIAAGLKAAGIRYGAERLPGRVRQSYPLLIAQAQ